MRLPNGYGSVYKLSGNRRNPWIVKKTREIVYDEIKDKEKQLYDIIGYYETKAKALQALAKYNEDPYDLHVDSITFSEAYEKWSEEHFKTIVVSATRNFKSAYSYCSPIHNLKMKEIRTSHLEETIKNADVGDSTKSRMKSLFNLMYRYAMRHEIVDKNYAQLCSSFKPSAVARENIPFSDSEIQTLWDNIYFPYADMVLVEIYSGWRPQEIAILKTQDIDLEELTMLGGLKTDAGKNRKVPIHNMTRPLIEKRHNPQNEFLFMDEENNKMTYDKYKGRFNKVMKQFGMKHHMHETRHTFITMAKRSNVDEYMLKLMVGHAITDITEKIYTHRTMDQLRIEMDKIK